MAIVQNDYAAYLKTSDGEIPLRDLDAHEEISSLSEEIDLLSTGFYNLHPKYYSGGIDKTNGSFIDNKNLKRTEKLNLDNYEYVNFYTDGAAGQRLYVTVFEYGSDDEFLKVIVDTLKSYKLIPTPGNKYAITLWFGGSDFGHRLDHFFVIAKSLLNKFDKEDIENRLNEVEQSLPSLSNFVKLDIPDDFFIIKGNTLELFKYGMYYSDSEYIPNEYNVRVVNIDQYVTSYSDKIVINCPEDFEGDSLRNPFDSPLFQLLNKQGRVIEQKRVTIHVGDPNNITNIIRNVMYMGDSLTGMGYRSKETARMIGEETNLSKTKLIGKMTGDGDGNYFTGTGGYSWANYVDNPSALPPAYNNNYLWDNEKQDISMKYLVEQIGESDLNYVIILLGWNDYESGAFSESFTWESMKERVEKVIEVIHSEYPNCKIILESYHYMYPYERKSYGNTMPQVRHNKYIYDLNRFYQNIANSYDFVWFLQMSCCIDVLHNMNMVEEVANKRTTEKVKYCSDVVHPADIGFYQYSDAEFSALLYLMK